MCIYKFDVFMILKFWKKIKDIWNYDENIMWFNYDVSNNIN